MKPATKRLRRRVEHRRRRAELLDPAGPHHGDAVADRQRLGLVVGDEHRRRARSTAAARRRRRGSAPAGWGRGWRTARRAASGAVPAPARGRARRAGARRPTARAGSGRRGRPSPTSPSQWSRRRCPLGAAEPRRPKATFSATVRCGNRACSWNTSPTWRRSGSTPARRRRRRPRRRCAIAPASAPISPATSRSSVDLPHPLGPTRASSSPSSSARSTSSTATVAAERLGDAPSSCRAARSIGSRSPAVGPHGRGAG